ncbi:MAG: hypothetical protein ACE5EK_00305 [Nitrospinales bacterium]
MKNWIKDFFVDLAGIGIHLFMILLAGWIYHTVCFSMDHYFLDDRIREALMRKEGEKIFISVMGLTIFLIGNMTAYKLRKKLGWD